MDSFFFIVLSSIAPYNTTSYKIINKKESAILRSFLPEGFGFFTRNPQEEFPVIFREINDTLIILTKPNGSPSNFFGLKRNQRTMFAELGSIVQDIPIEDWTTCSIGFERCLNFKNF
ncbi:MAG: SdpA family antimicrobial peptide system protein [Cyclobacteriaceae bacterium]|nr:SdpA family antimicrobial peptide system protein [Cyclobacteriaceae bacterium]